MKVIEQIRKQNKELEKLNKTLVELHNNLTGEGKTADGIIEEIMNKKETGYKWDKSIKCKRCEYLFKPFYFGDKSLHRKVIQECPKCNELNTFRPIDVQGEPNKFIEGI